MFLLDPVVVNLFEEIDTFPQEGKRIVEKCQNIYLLFVLRGGDNKTLEPITFLEARNFSLV